jgi:hypothetical protein
MLSATLPESVIDKEEIEGVGGMKIKVKEVVRWRTAHPRYR